MSSLLIDSFVNLNEQEKIYVAEQMEKIAKQLRSGKHHAFILVVGPYDVIADWKDGNFSVIR